MREYRLSVYLYFLSLLLVLSCSEVILRIPVSNIIIHSNGKRMVFSLSEIQSKQLSIFTDQTIQLFQGKKPLFWKNSNPETGSVNSSGTFTPLKIGATELETTFKGQVIQFKVVVSQKQNEWDLPTILLKDHSGLSGSLPTKTNETVDTNPEVITTSTQPSNNLKPTISHSPHTSPIPESNSSPPSPSQSIPPVPNESISLPPLPVVKNLKVLSTFTTLTLSWQVTELELAVGFNLYLNGKLIPPTGTLQKQDKTFTYTFNDMQSNKDYLLGISVINQITGETNPETIESKTANLLLSQPSDKQSFSLGSKIVFKTLIQNFSHGEPEGQIIFTKDNKSIQVINNGWDTNDVSPGEYILQANVKNPTNQILASSEKITVSLYNSTGTIDTVPPQITHVNPINDYSDITHTITLNGNLLDTNMTVTLNSQPPVTLSNLIATGKTKVTATLPPVFKKGSFSITVDSPNIKYTSPPVIVLKKRHFVDKDATGANNGNTWTDAFKFLDEALTTGSNDDEFWIADGTYIPTRVGLRAASYVLKAGNKIYGGFKGTELDLSLRNSTANPTILSGDLNGDDVGLTNNGENTFHVISSANNTLLDSLFISGGNANGGGANDNGGGINHLSGTLILNDVTLRFNRANTDGGGIYNSGGTLTITSSSFENNSGGNAGAALRMINNAISTLNNVSFESNTATASGGGGINAGTSTLTISNASFNNNSAQNGGGLACFGCTLNLTKTAFTSNSANFGGAIRLHNTANVVVKESIFMGNSSPEGGALAASTGVINVPFQNTIFYGNTSTNRGGAVKNSNNARVIFVNSTFVNNTATNQGGAIVNIGTSRSLITNCIFRGNTATTGAQVHDTSGGGNLTEIGFTNIQGGIGGVANSQDNGNNINLDPLFVNISDPDGADNRFFTSDDGLKLQGGSPSLNTGTAAGGNVPIIDILNISRPQSGTNDMGAYEQ